MRRLAAIALLLAPFLIAAAPRTPTSTAVPAAPQVSGREVLLLQVDGTINPIVASYIAQGIRNAQERDAAALVIELDTPGGLVESAKTIVKDLLGAPIPVIVYVAPSGSGAISAGVFITMAAHVAAMAPGTTIGAAHPVGGGGENIEGDMGDKVENFVASLSRSIAEQRGRNAEWAEKAVRESVSITEREAVKLKVVDLVADDLPSLLNQVAGREVRIDGQPRRLETAAAVVVPQPMSLAQRLFNMLAHPNIAYFLMMAGLFGLYVEFSNPGLMFPGVVGAICLLLALAAFQVLPINWAGLALIGLGMAMLVAEMFLPSFGVVGIGGLIAFVLGSLLLFDTPDSTLSLDRGLVAGFAVTLGGFSLLVGWLVVRAQRSQPTVGAEGMIGEIGQVRRVHETGGKVKVFVHGEYWDAASDDAVAVGDAVEVVRVDGLQLRVRRRATH